MLKRLTAEFLGTFWLVLGGCVTRDPAVSVSNATPSGNWKIEKTVDRVTGAPLPSAQLMTRTSSNSAVRNAQPGLPPPPSAMSTTCAPIGAAAWRPPASRPWTPPPWTPS